MKLSISSTLLFLFPVALMAQQPLSGVVKDGATAAVLPGVSLINITTGKTVITDDKGAFQMMSRPGDTLRFSMIGYMPQQVAITKELFSLPSLPIYMQQGVITLQQQLVRGRNYASDSLRLREEYAAYFKKQQNWDFNLLLPPVNKQDLRDQLHTVRQHISINQLYTNLSFRRNKRRAAFRRQLLEKESEDYVQRRYDPAMVQRITGLQGDSLDYFMAHYRPSPALLAGNNSYDLSAYIKQLYQQYKDSIETATAVP
ncbi:MAG: carboxypeptidase-like regulatory domain-containing protein [Chitinophaga sp.]|uniref:carboxypeptidase-like regulatory domain-containing protein n=1 Tax=Chitinophaga sp. TaxID=1869181 RepID=UPI001B2C4531|nr:carboxypeptidase-like regulatory domain-containing protein [Chitinophaga sp.]MBO9728811.1 carboxypeptidase-like regulatory domain-containing protein [Chitinophaga sp.]